MRLGEDTLTAMRADIEQWAQDTTNALQGSLSAIGAVDSGEGRASIRNQVKHYSDGSSGISFKFLRRLVYIEKGAGKGYGGTKGSQWRHNGQKKTTNPNSFGKMGTGRRPARPWFNPVIRMQVRIIRREVAEYYRVRAANILIK